MGRTATSRSAPAVAAIAPAIALLIALAFAPAAAQAGVSGDSPCPASPVYSWSGNSVATNTAVPSSDPGSPGVTYPATVLRPADTVAYPGPRPVVVLQHAQGGDRCSLWWLAAFLAGHGFVAETHTAPNGSQAVAFANTVAASRSAVAFMRSAANPASAVTDPERLGFAGHSLGSVAGSLIQGEGRGIDALVAFDNLRRYVLGDPGGSNNECSGEPGGEVVPTVPALGFAKDEPCNSGSQAPPPDVKQFGYSYWRSKGLPAMELPMRGFEHLTFAGTGANAGNETQHRDVSHYVLAWFTPWLEADASQDAALLSPTVNGRPAQQVLSAYFTAAACLPGRVDTSDLSGWLTTGSPAPAASGACDPPALPVPPDASGPAPEPGAARLARLVARGPKRIAPRGKAKLRVTISNLGELAAGRTRIRIASSNRRVKVRGRLAFGSVPAGGSARRTLTIRAKPGAGGVARITVRVAGLKRVLRVRVR